MIFCDQGTLLTKRCLYQFSYRKFLVWITKVSGCNLRLSTSSTATASNNYMRAKANKLKTPVTSLSVMTEFTGWMTWRQVVSGCMLRCFSVQHPERKKQQNKIYTLPTKMRTVHLFFFTKSLRRQVRSSWVILRERAQNYYRGGEGAQN